jgi:hypothetical protein
MKPALSGESFSVKYKSHGNHVCHRDMHGYIMPLVSGQSLDRWQNQALTLKTPGRF